MTECYGESWQSQNKTVEANVNNNTILNNVSLPCREPLKLLQCPPWEQSAHRGPSPRTSGRAEPRCQWRDNFTGLIFSAACRIYIHWSSARKCLDALLKMLFHAADWRAHLPWSVFWSIRNTVRFVSPLMDIWAFGCILDTDFFSWLNVM